MTKHLFTGALFFILVAHTGRAFPFIITHVPDTKDTLIDVGGYKLHFVITRAGEPAILLEAGGGADASQWEAVRQKLATETDATIISYDRAGFGQSESPNTPYSLEKEVEDLHKCLETLGVNKIILVGHSYGAFLCQAYQFIYPKTIKAIILADPNNVPFVDSIGARILMNIPFDTTKPLTTTQRADVRQTIAFPYTITTVKKMPFSKEIPMVVISAGKDWWPFPQWNTWWKSSHQSIVNAAPNRKLIKAEGSAHNIPKDSPETIVNAIQDMLKN
jgi:pimeloyl-ACP methyl ester carboxylesterase